MGKQRKTKNIDLTVGNITSSLWKFAVPLMLGNVLQQLYNLVDTWVVGHYIGDNALAAVGSSYTVNDLPDIDRHRALSWKQCIFIDGLWQKKSESDPKRHFYFCGCDRFTGGDSDRDHLYLDESDDPSASGAAGNDSGDAGISFLCLYRIFCHFFI